MANIDASELDDVSDNILRLANIEDRVERKVEEEAQQLVTDIQYKIKQKGLIDHSGDGDKPGQPPLVASFDAQQSGGSSWTIYSTAEHAMALEEGAKPHHIEPKNAALLAWVPENPGDYPVKEGDEYIPEGTWYDPDDGMVYSTGVSHPGNDAYHYIQEAQAGWWPIARIKIDKAVQQGIRRAGFERSIGGSGLDSDPDFIGGGL